MVCIEDVLHMLIRVLSQKPLLCSFLEQVDLLGGCHIFINLLHRSVIFSLFEKTILIYLKFVVFREG